jgi:prevent-host-death family protein
MARYAVAEAKNNLPKLLDNALAGEEVMITRRGEPIVKLAPQRAVGVRSMSNGSRPTSSRPGAGPISTVLR